MRVAAAVSRAGPGPHTRQCLWNPKNGSGTGPTANRAFRSRREVLT